MKYFKNKATLTGKVVLLGIKHEGVDLILVDTGKKSVTPVCIKHLQSYVKLNSTVTVTGELEQIQGFHYIKADSIETTKNRASSSVIELTGVLFKSKAKAKSLYKIKVDDKEFVVTIPITDTSIIKLTTVSNLKLEYRTPAFISRCSINLKDANLICINYTSL